MGKHLVLVGAGHAHLTTLLHAREFLDRGHAVTLISPTAYQYYSGMGPGMLAGLYEPREARFNVRKMAEDRGVTFVENAVSRLDPEGRRLFVQDGQSLHYDIASFNTGSSVPLPSPQTSHDRVIPVKPVINLYRASCSMLKEDPDRELRVLVVGGGPAGVEVAGNVWRLLRDQGRPAQITLVAGRRVLESLPARARELALRSLAKRDIRVCEGTRLQSLTENRALLSDGGGMLYDYAFAATGVQPSTMFRESGLRVAEDGALPVNASLQSSDYPELFGGGDCISMAGRRLARVGVYAVRQNPILLHNLQVALGGGVLQVFVPDENYLLILNLGDGTGILCKRGWVWNGSWAFVLKDFIDRRFMRKFQVSGELAEATLDDAGCR